MRLRHALVAVGAGAVLLGPAAAAAWADSGTATTGTASTGTASTGTATTGQAGAAAVDGTAAAPATLPTPAPLATPGPASAGTLVSPPATPSAPTGPHGPSLRPSPGGVSVNIPTTVKPSTSITIILLITVLGVAPSLLILCTSFTKMVVVLSLTRNALGLQGIPPNQVLVGFALFLSLFVMGPTLSKMNSDGLQPYLHHQKTVATAIHDGEQPLRQFMLRQTENNDIATIMGATHQAQPRTPADVGMTTLIPAFLLSELRSAFIIGFVIFIPFLVIDLVVSSSLMSMGMMMMPPTLVSLPFKLLLFVLVDGWGLVVQSLVRSYR